jgi:uncharacterized membrane protein YebE (DUF533 family)
MASGSGGKAGSLLLVLLLLVGAAGGNYYRNWRAEQAEPETRPLSGYETAGLEKLAEAYRTEIRALQAQLDRTGHAQARDRGFIDEQVREFERVQRSAARKRELTGDIAQREARLRDVEQELALRKQRGSGLQVHLRRLVGI